jgi:hypothetical protein
VDTLVLKLVLTPLLIGTASLAGRRWGPAVGGSLVGLPLTSGPVAFFLAISHGTSFAAAVATGTLIGTASPAVYCLAYAWLADYGWPLAVAAGCAVFTVATLLFQQISLPLPAVFAAVIAELVVVIRLMPRLRPIPRGLNVPPWWDIPARMVVATTFVLVLTGAASALGARLTGLLTTFPLYATVLTVFAHHLQGAEAAKSVLRGLLFGLFGFATFFLVLAALLQPVGIVGAFAAAIAAGLTLQAGSLMLLRRGARLRKHV